MSTPTGPVNPYLPDWEYVPDAEPRVFGDRLFAFGSHDRFGAFGFCLNDYVVWSTPLDDLSAWTSHGVAYRGDQDPLNHVGKGSGKSSKRLSRTPGGKRARKSSGKRPLFAPDVVQGADGRFYLYYGMGQFPAVGVAVADAPQGPYEFLAHVTHRSGQRLGGQRGDIYPFDPAVLVDDDGRVYLYTGQAPSERFRWFVDRQGLRHEGAYVMQLDPSDMHTVIDSPRLVAPGARESVGTSFEGHGFFEASSIHKVEGVYHFVYSTVLMHELGYATSDRPDGGFTYAGTLVSNGDVGLQGRPTSEPLNYTANNHGGLVQLDQTWFVFYHRHTNSTWFARQGCAEPLQRDEDGRFLQAEITSSGLRNGALPGVGTYSAAIACVLMGPKGARPMPVVRLPGVKHPYLTQSGKDREGAGDQHVTNLRDGAVVGFRYLDLSSTRQLSLQATSTHPAAFLVSTELGGEPVAVVPVGVGAATVLLPAGLPARSGLYLRYSGPGRGELRSFTMS